MTLCFSSREYEKKEKKHSMKNSFLWRTRHTKPVDQQMTQTPGWVKVAVGILLLLILLFVILHLTGHGFGDHMHMSILEHGRQPL
jgi:hypothetical protein